MTKKQVIGLKLHPDLSDLEQKVYPIILNNTIWKVKASIDPVSGKRLKLITPARFQMILFYKHCFLLHHFPYHHRYVLYNVAFVTGAEKDTQASCEHRSKRNIVNQNNTHFCPDSRNLSYSTDILQQRACRVWTAEQLVLIIWSPREEKKKKKRKRDQPHQKHE